MSISKTILKNGIKVVTEEITNVKSITVGVWIKTGSRDEDESLAGITHFLEHMLFKGTERRTAFEIAQSMEAVGGYMNAFTSTEYTCYYTRCLDTQLELSMDVLSDMILHSTFPDEEIAKERKVVLEEMKMYRDSPEDVVFEEFNRQIFPDHPLGRPIIGFESTVSGFRRDQLSEYISHHYQPWNMLVAVAGNVRHEDVVRHAEHYLTSLATSREDGGRRGSEDLGAYVRSERTLTKKIEQTHMVVGRRGLSYDHEDRVRLLLANTVLSGGMSSRLHQNIREKYGYCYSVSSFSHAYADAGVFGVYIGTDREYVDHVRELIRHEFDQLRSVPIPEREWSESKTQLKGKMLLAQESMSNRMMRLAKSELYFNRYITLDELVEEIDAVTREEVREFCEKFLDYSDFSETLLLPETGS